MKKSQNLTEIFELDNTNKKNSLTESPCPSVGVCVRLSVCAIAKHPFPGVVETFGQKPVPNIGLCHTIFCNY